MLKPDTAKIMTFKSPKDLSKWLQANHATESELWVKIFNKGSGIPSVTWNEVVIETLCWGWIDGVKKSLDDRAYLQRITPRKTRSNWSKAKQFCETLTKSNRYAIAYGLETAKKPETRQRRFKKFMDMLIREEKPDFGFNKGKKA